MLRGDEAKQKCPDIIIFNVPEKRGKADLTKYRLAGAEVGMYNIIVITLLYVHTCTTYTYYTYIHCTVSGVARSYLMVGHTDFHKAP